jgi:hypothetical protein
MIKKNQLYLTFMAVLLVTKPLKLKTLALLSHEAPANSSPQTREFYLRSNMKTYKNKKGISQLLLNLITKIK